MKLLRLLPTLLLGVAFSQGVLAWDNEDHEIFDIVSALEQAEGKGTTFYSFVNVTKSATEKDITKAYRKLSLEMHPDKVGDDKVVADRFARLGTIVGILRDAEKRKRYDFFYDHGVPKWRGTGYYYSRWRPGFGTVVASLLVFSCFVHYFILVVSYYVSKMRIKVFHQQALEHAWGAGKKPLAGRKRLHLKTGEQGDPLGVPGINGGRPTAPGAIIQMVVEGTSVYVVEDGEEHLFSEANAKWPSASQTWVPRIIKNRSEWYAWATGNGPVANSSSNGQGEYETTTETRVNEKTGKKETVVVKKPKGPMRGVELQGKVGGRRRVVKPSKPVAPAKEEKKEK
ncbi:BQ5605_C004g02940 [Microbotryum silenes-dioicae]|uniref:BQ5605_C004g02940 protein n=1 Tax=Microbotryum silenes-dioicae TaxID=796604 RepID=A0A2X0M996_9BASI|nr:BQ5605_C004g02940 [Microbotryum silenes-dioicae]